MATTAKPTKEKTRQERMQDRKNVAKQQLNRIPDLTKALFAEKDLTKFLLMVSRMPYYCFQNLLIIYNKYPEASVLAGFPVWQRLMASEASQMVLKQEAIGKGIDLIVPFTNVIGDNQYELTWFSVLVFDVRQTNVRNYNLRPSVYIQDALHTQFVLDAVIEVLGSSYGRRVIHVSSTSSLLSSGAKGTIGENTVSVRRGLKDEAVLFWLTEVLCELEIGSAAFSLPTRRLLQQCVQFCLYSMWSIENPGILPGSHFNVPAHEQADFLDILQKAVFSLHQRIAGAYLSFRHVRETNEDDLLNIDIK